MQVRIGCHAKDLRDDESGTRNDAIDIDLHQPNEFLLLLKSPIVFFIREQIRDKPGCILTQGIGILYESSIYIRRCAGSQVRKISHAKIATQPRFSPLFVIALKRAF